MRVKSSSESTDLPARDKSIVKDAELLSGESFATTAGLLAVPEGAGTLDLYFLFAGSLRVSATVLTVEASTEEGGGASEGIAGS